MIRATHTPPTHGKSGTQVLERAATGTVAPADPVKVFDLAYDALRRLACSYLKEERDDHTLQPTALVHEAWLRMAGGERIELRDRDHFTAVAARAMRRVLIDHARTRGRDKRGGGQRPLDVEIEHFADTHRTTVDLLALDRALDELRACSERQASIVELRFFGGLSMPAIASTVGSPLRTVEREWRFARAWLTRRLGATEQK